LFVESADHFVRAVGYFLDHHQRHERVDLHTSHMRDELKMRALTLDGSILCKA
jgi:hypothetical protein